MSTPRLLFSLGLLSLSAGYALAARRLARALREAPRPPEVPAESLPHVAVLVAARDEEATLGRCLRALRAQDYPPGRLEIVVADDASSDATARVADEASRGPGHPVRLVRLDEPAPGAALRGKARALHAAYGQTRAPLLLVTDADCAPPPRWARRTAALFEAAPGVGIAGGLTAVRVRRGRLGDRVQALDWAFLLGAAGALAAGGRTSTLMGNNLAFRRAAYQSVGGYPALPFSVTEDYALLRAIVDGTPWKAGFTMEPDTTVETLPAAGLRAAFAQRRRWVRGGLRAPRPAAIAGGLAYAAHAGLLVGFALAPRAAGLGLALKAWGDASLFRAVALRTGRPFDARGLAPFEAYVLVYLPLLPLSLALAPRVRWKGRVSGRKQP